MKKLFKKREKSADSQPPSSRITNDTLAAHREQVLAGGKRFKYPLQYTRHKLVINTIIIGVVTIIALVGIAWHQLYIAQNSDAFFYRVAKITSLPVGSIDDQQIRFSDFLLNYRTAKHYLSNYDQTRPDTDAGKAQLELKKREAFDVAVADAYARKIAKAKNITVSADEVSAALDQLRNASNGKLTAETSNASSRRILGLNEDDLETLVRNSILRGKAAFEVDENAKNLQAKVDGILKANNFNYDAVKEKLSANEQKSIATGVSGLISDTSIFGGLRASDIAKMKKGESSNVMRSVTGDGYYYVRLLEKNDSQISFAFVHIPLKQFKEDIQKLKNDHKIQEYISVKSTK